MMKHCNMKTPPLTQKNMSLKLS